MNEAEHSDQRQHYDQSGDCFSDTRSGGKHSGRRGWRHRGPRNDRVIGTLTFRFGVKLPYRKLLIVNGLLVVSIMVTFSGSTVRLFQTVGWLPIDPIPHLHIPNWVSLWFGFYPSWQGVLIPLAMLGYVGGAWLLTKWLSARARKDESVVAPSSTRTTPPSSIHS